MTKEKQKFNKSLRQRMNRNFIQFVTIKDNNGRILSSPIDFDDNGNRLKKENFSGKIIDR